MSTQTEHRGYAATRRTGGALLRKIQAAEINLYSVPLEERDEQWATSMGGVKHASDLLAQGRRAKAGKVLAKAVAS